MTQRQEVAPTEAWFRSPTVIWVALMAATITTTWVLSHDSFAATTSAVATFALVAWKVRLILLDFMELRHAPWLPRVAFELWSIGVPVMIVSFYLAS